MLVERDGIVLTGTPHGRCRASLDPCVIEELRLVAAEFFEGKKRKIGVAFPIPTASEEQYPSAPARWQSRMVARNDDRRDVDELVARDVGKVLEHSSVRRGG